MSSFSRGILMLPRQCIQTRILNLMAPSKGSFEQHRLFSSTIHLNALKQARSAPTPTKPISKALPKSLPKTKALVIPQKTPTTPTPTYRSFASTLAQKERPTVLYEAPSHTIYIFSCYVAGTFCMSYAAISFSSQYIAAPADLPPWVPVLYGGISVGMAALATWLFLRPARLVRTITALPQLSSKVSQAVSKGLAKAGGAPDLKIEVQLRKMFPVPFFPARKIYANPSEMILPSPVVPVEVPLTSKEVRLARLEEEAKRKAALEYERSHIMTAPFRDASKALYTIFTGMRRVFSQEGFMKLNVKGQVYKLDVTGGWALDGGRALDRLVTIKPL